MARIRMIKPEFFDDTNVADLSMAARLCFIGLWTQADRDGRLEDDPRRLKARLFPYDNVDVAPLLDELAVKEMVTRYHGEDGRAYLAIPKFAKHQRPHPKEPPSMIAAPVLAVKKHGKKCKPLQARQNEPCKNISSPSESGVLILDSGVLSTESGTRKLEPALRAVTRFDAFWSIYPNKKGKDDALKAWNKRHPTEALTDLIIAAVERQKTWPTWMKDGGRFIPHPATWLNRGSWDDEPTIAAVSLVSDVGRQNAANGEMALQMMEARDAVQR